ncbi:MAG: transposase [Candidatus Pacebacteria bacterium]|nr:transposase [Candidatus Paceibacterota bacterium]
MQLFHVLNRGVDGRSIFMSDKDRLRFVHNLYEFNDTAPVTELSRRNSTVGLRKSHMKERALLVDIHGWVLMKNHYHLLISERVDGGITSFLRKLNIGYAKYFNEQHKRLGTLFQGRTKKILIERDEHFLYILHYLHLNPLDHFQGSENWRIRNNMKIKSVTEAVSYLDSYRWSSYLDYNGKHNFPSLLTTTLFREALDDPQKALKEYLEDAERTDETFTRLNLE